MRKSLLKQKTLVLLFSFLFCLVSAFSIKEAKAMPFYNLKPKPLTVRSSFQTSFSTSTNERKHNIKLGAKALNNVFLDVGEEFSFNKTVGERSEKRGYKTAKIIVNGEFVDGVGGGICQVSTTLYNAVLLAGLKVTEYHPHSLQVSYVAPSFDAMVNSSSADLRFINNTYNPIIINTVVTDDIIKVIITGEELDCVYKRKSVIKGYVEPDDYELVVDEKGEYPELYEGESLIIKNPKNGVKSEGVIIKEVDGREVFSKVIRKDSYKPIKGIKVLGTKKMENIEEIEKEEWGKRLIEEILKLNFNIYKKPFDNILNL